MPRFVILEHSRPDLPAHWDLMLEQDGALLTWQVPVSPQQWGEAPVTCRKIFDHRLKYLDYEGEIRGKRGAVKRVDAGEYILRSLRSKTIEIETRCGSLPGRIRLSCQQDDLWQLRVSADP